MAEKTLAITIVGDADQIEFVRTNLVATVEEWVDENSPELTVDWEIEETG